MQVSRWHLSLSDSLHIVTWPDDVCQLQLSAVCTDRVVRIDRYVAVFGDMRKLALISRVTVSIYTLLSVIPANSSMHQGVQTKTVTTVGGCT